MSFGGGEYLITGTAVSIANALAITEVAKKHPSQIILRNDTGAANDAFVGPSTVTTAANRACQLKATDAYPTYIEGPLDIGEIYLVGTAAAGNIIHIALVYG